MPKAKIPRKLRLEVLERDGFKCLWCGRGAPDGVKLEVDHVLPESFGGPTSYENSGTLCSDCNGSKSNEYFGDYLITTIMKAPNIWSRVIGSFYRKHLGPDGKLYDGDWYYLRLFFFKKEGNRYSKEHITHPFLVHGSIRVPIGDSDSIKLADIEKEARLEFKNKVREYLFENKGFFEQIGERLVFRERK